MQCNDIVQQLSSDIQNNQSINSIKINTISENTTLLEFSITSDATNYSNIFHPVHLKIMMKNICNETLDLDMGGYPSGSFYIFNDHERLIYIEPKYFLTFLWEVTLQPDENITLLESIWYQITNIGRIVPAGTYHIIGKTCLISYNGTRIQPDFIGPISIHIARSFIYTTPYLKIIENTPKINI